MFAAWAAEQVDDEQRSTRDRAEGPVDIPVALVAPPSLLEGWLQEIDRRLDPSLFPRVLWGQTAAAGHFPRPAVALSDFLVNARGAGTVLEHARVDLDALRRARPSLLLIGYDTLRRLQFAVGQLRFGVLLADETQAIKEPSSLRSRALRAMNYDFGLALTGTPIENTWRDLWTLCDFSVPGRLGTQQLETFASWGGSWPLGWSRC